jgi:hypothetical protein
MSTSVLAEFGEMVASRRLQGAQEVMGLYIARQAMELHERRAELAANGPSGATMLLVVCEPRDP